MAARPLVSVQGTTDSLVTPHVLLTSIRPDVVHFVHTSMAKNRRQAYAVNPQAGKLLSCEVASLRCSSPFPYRTLYRVYSYL